MRWLIWCRSWSWNRRRFSSVRSRSRSRYNSIDSAALLGSGLVHEIISNTTRYKAGLRHRAGGGVGVGFPFNPEERWELGISHNILEKLHFFYLFFFNVNLGDIQKIVGQLADFSNFGWGRYLPCTCLIRSPISNTWWSPWYPRWHTWPNYEFHRLFDSGFALSALNLCLNTNAFQNVSHLCKGLDAYYTYRGEWGKTPVEVISRNFHW